MTRLASTTARGYGTQHQRLRRQWTPNVNAGLVDCARCGKLIQPGDAWDLGHDDTDRSRYTGPEHQACNRATNTTDRHDPDPTPKPRTRW